MDERQQKFIDVLVETGDAKLAEAAAGYADTYRYQLLKNEKIQKELMRLMRSKLVLKASKAINTVEDVMDNKSASAANTSRLNAANSVLDRVGLGKAETLEIKSENSHGLFIIPAKKAPEAEES